MKSRRRAFYEPSRYPDVDALRPLVSTLLGEARQVYAGLGARLAVLGDSYILPLVPEPEDSNPISDQVFAQARTLAPITTAKMSELPYIVSYAFSRVAPGAEIPEHDHWNPYLVALLCLTTGPGVWIRVGGETRTFAQGEIILFDYTLPHAVANPSDQERIVLLMVIDPKRAPPA